MVGIERGFDDNSLQVSTPVFEPGKDTGFMDEQYVPVREQLRAAVKSVEAPPFLETRLRAALGRAARPARWSRRGFAVPALATVALIAAGTFEYEHGGLRFNRNSQDAYVASISSYVPRTLRVGLGDHVHCSVYARTQEHPETAQKMIGDLGPEFAPLLPVVESKVSGDLRLMTAHRCSYRHRRFIHFSFSGRNALLSVVIARKQDGEQLTGTELNQVLAQSGTTIYRSEVQRFQIAAFDAGNYFAYVVSDLSSTRNSQIAAALSPELRGFLALRS